MKSLRNLIKNSKQSGFTLIELLVVIGILGIMAAALIATIDPFEQIKKADDATLKTTSVEFQNAIIRYYSNHGALPWHTVANGGSACHTATTIATPLALTSLATCITSLVNDGELKQAFSSSSNLGSIYITNPNPQTANPTDSIVCFLPQSKAQQEDLNTKYNQNGSTATGCKSQTAGTGGTSCYWCAQ